MDEKNKIIVSYARAVCDIANALNEACIGLGESEAENLARIKTITIYLDALRSQTTILQTAIEQY